ncbi:diphosphomevalonate/mevalonate 3,5-bisphosphate decarboxylase family protein [Aureitalea marina]|uniref:Diphosphomevalonate decarboxylase n=1 Tax=Aureitalea marina TaxID=930804 RepID=A0A2S7KLP3_9FLAO|nr:diphosphomevalonate decarboxylase [Aureitalea marina]PQB03500.1 diphosphomevalonate decarboxylase [Aureitalea marina]
MDTNQFVPSHTFPSNGSGQVCWEAPSNIALVKYWGKREPQIPLNPSVSFTLDTCRTKTSLSYSPRNNASAWFEVYLDGERKPGFEPKITKFFERISAYCPFLWDYHWRIETSNSFPHSSGIASSASGMAALAMALVEVEQQLSGVKFDEIQMKTKASFLARLGSGSACRSIDGGLVVWGVHDEVDGSNDLFGVRLNDSFAPIFKTYHDTIMLVHQGQKVVSSTVGHGLMHGHPYAEQRFERARANLSSLLAVLRSGDLDEFIRIVEAEALDLHAMMLTSDPNFILMKPGTLQILEAVREYRKSSGNHLCFTLDAGANAHLLYPDNEAIEVLEFIKNKLAHYCENGAYICDQVGSGVKKC